MRRWIVEAKQILNDTEHKMEHSITALRKELTGIRTGKASPALLDHIQVEAYGSMTPLNQVGSVSIPDGRTIAVQPWDKQMVDGIMRAIQSSDLGLTPNSDGTVIHIPVPPLTEERRRDYVKMIKHFGEECKISIRNVRREMNDKIKKEEKEGAISEDESKRYHKTIQEFTDHYVVSVDETLIIKEKEIMEI
jgi:ribosome recycling factor